MGNRFGQITLLLVGIAIGLGSYHYLYNKSDKDTGMSKTDEPEPLYWVAPMDANYRRDKPGKSPMGMDLVPVYQTESAPDDPGTVRISPDVVNNLGVRTTQVKWDLFDSTIKTVGYVQYDENQLIHIHPRVEGWIEKLYVKSAGDPVEKDKPLFEIYSPALVNAQEELVQALNRQNNPLIKAATQRLKALRVSERTIAELKKSRQAQQTITVYSPQSGVIDNLNIREGFFVKPGTTMMSIGGLENFWVLAEVFERQMETVKQGDEVTLSIDSLPSYKFKGVVDYVYPTINSKTRTASVRMSVKNFEGKLKPNMLAQVYIHNKDQEQSLLIPKEALIRTGNQDRVVLALGEGKFKSIEVTIGRMGDNSAEVLNGLLEGDRIVTSAHFLLDSESSKTSDFIRMHHADDPVEKPDSVWVEAMINSVMPDMRMINVDHPPIKQWQWPSMTMDFDIAKTVDMALFEKGKSVHIEISKQKQGGFQISAIKLNGNVSNGQDQSKDENMIKESGSGS